MLQNYVDTSLNPYVTSEFSSHGLLAVGTVMATALGGCVPLTMAKAIDIWGRVEGFCLMLLVCVAGMIMKAVCTNVKTYIAAHVLYWTGHIGLLYVIDVMCADITSLKNRMIIFGINGTPRIAATFAGPEIAALFYRRPGWRWAFGTFTIILVACSVPAMGLMLYMYRKARKSGYAEKQRSGRNMLESLKSYFIEFDSKFKTHCAHHAIIDSYSYWNIAPHVCLLPFHATFHPRWLRSQWLEDRLHHCHDCSRYSARPYLCSLREVPRACPFPSVEIPQGTYHCRFLPSLRCHVPFGLYLERILQFVSAGCPQTEYSTLRIHFEFVLSHIIRLWPSDWNTYQLHW